MAWSVAEKKSYFAFFEFEDGVGDKLNLWCIDGKDAHPKETPIGQFYSTKHMIGSVESIGATQDGSYLISVDSFRDLYIWKLDLVDLSRLERRTSSVAQSNWPFKLNIEAWVGFDIKDKPGFSLDYYTEEVVVSSRHGLVYALSTSGKAYIFHCYKLVEQANQSKKSSYKPLVLEHKAAKEDILDLSFAPNGLFAYIGGPIDHEDMDIYVGHLKNLHSNPIKVPTAGKIKAFLWHPNGHFLAVKEDDNRLRVIKSTRWSFSP